MPPKPRPKPRPRAAPVQPTGEGSAPKPDPTLLSGCAPLEEEDLFFIKRFTSWDEIDRKEKRAREAELKEERGPVSNEEFGGQLESPQRQSNPTFVSEVKPLPAWTRSLKDTLNQASLTIDLGSSDSDSDGGRTSRDERNTDVTLKVGPSSRQMKRARSRSRSLTPPPTLNQEDVRNVRNILRRTQGSPSKNSSYSTVPTDLPVDDDDDMLDPELRRIRESVRQHSNRAESIDVRQSVESEDEDEDPTNQVILLVTWVHDPESVNPMIIEKEMEFPYPRHTNFQKLFDTLSDILNIHASHLALFHNNRRVYPGSSPDLLKMWEKAKMTVCEHGTIKYLQWHQSQQPHASTSASRGRPSSVMSETDENSEKLKLIIRSANNEFLFRVRAATTCGELVAKFLAKAGLPSSHGKKKPAILLDGDKQADGTTVADLDINDGDMLEIIDIQV